MDKLLEKESIQPVLEKFLKSKILLYFVVFVFVIRIFSALIFINFPSNIFFADITKSTLVSMLNQTRQSLGLNTLSENAKLDQAAQLKAEDMVRNGYFSHISPAGTTPWHWFLQSGYNYKYAGENLAIGFYDSEEVYQAWLNSSSHKKNMLNSAYTEIGTAILTGFGDNNAIVVVQLFGTPKATAAAEKNIAKEKAQETPPDKTETTSAPKEQKVLSSSTSLEAYQDNAINDFYSRFLNFVFYSYDKLLQYIIYGLLVVVIGIFAAALSFNFNNHINSGLVLRSLILIVLLFSSILINKGLIISIFPHQITI